VIPKYFMRKQNRNAVLVTVGVNANVMVVMGVKLLAELVMVVAN
jgi:hypothetical protein